MEASEPARLSAILVRIPAPQRAVLTELLPPLCQSSATELQAPVLTCVRAAADPRPLPAVVGLDWTNAGPPGGTESPAHC